MCVCVSSVSHFFYQVKQTHNNTAMRKSLSLFDVRLATRLGHGGSRFCSIRPRLLLRPVPLLSLMSFHTTSPGLSHATKSTRDERIQTLANILGCSAKKVGKLVAGWPQLLGYNADSMRLKITELAEILAAASRKSASWWCAFLRC